MLFPIVQSIFYSSQLRYCLALKNNVLLITLTRASVCDLLLSLVWFSHIVKWKMRSIIAVHAKWFPRASKYFRDLKHPSFSANLRTPEST